MFTRSHLVRVLLFAGGLGTHLSACGSDSSQEPEVGPLKDASGTSETQDGAAEAKDGAVLETADAAADSEAGAGLLSCGTFSADAGTTVLTHSVIPKTSDPAITATWNAPHVAYLSPSGPHRCSLLVFLTGLGGNPSATNPFLLHAAKRGFHVLDLEYANTISPSPTCETSTDADCHLKLRQEELEGGNLSSLITVSVADGIENRIAKALTHLAKTYPAEGWSTFLSDPSTPLWSSILISGHSHGASTSGVIGILRSVSRVIMLAGPYDFRGTATKTSAPWLARSSLTPKSAFFAFSHTADTQTPQDIVNWDTAQIPIVGTRANVDSAKVPYGNTHQLTSSLAGGGHGSPTSNATYAPVWDYMLGL